MYIDCPHSKFNRSTRLLTKLKEYKVADANRVVGVVVYKSENNDYKLTENANSSATPSDY